MFRWIKTRGVRSDQTRRTFRPGADRLESREVLSTLPTAAAEAARTFAALHPSASFNNVLTRGLESSGLYGNQNIFSSASRQVTNVAGVVSSVIAPPASGIVNNASTASTAATNLTRTTVSSRTPNLPRLGGFQSNVNPVAALNSALAAIPASFTASNNPALTNASAVTNGLAFTNGLGFSDSNNRFSSLSNANSASNGLAFTNGLGFSTPSAGNNGASNGLAFTNGTGFSTPAQRNTTSNNAASTGLAFTNGLGGTLPAGFNSLFNSANNGLAFTSGLGFTNTSNNPFLAGTTSTSSGPSFASSGLNLGSTTFGGFGASTSPFMIL